MQTTRRELLANAVAITTCAAIPAVTRAQTKTGVETSSRDRLEQALHRIADPNGEGARTCLTVYADAARAAADAADARSRAGISLGPLDGSIVSIKDLFDVKGETTRAGSKILATAPPATADAPVVRRLRAAGAVVIAKTNMSEFAISILGRNPHFGTPGNPADRTRIPGGSSSGAGVAVADGMCEIAIGSDTGGSCRVPAAFCGVVGFKPSKFRISTEGAFPFSYTFDSVGPLAKSVSECAGADAIMAGDDPRNLEAAPLQGMRLGIPQGIPLRDLDATVAARFSEATASLSRAGVRLSDETIELFEEMVRVNSRASIPTLESFAVHRERLMARAADFDPYARSRIEAGRNFSPADYIVLLRARAELVRGMDARLSSLDALVLPTTPRVAPTLDEVSRSSVETAWQTMWCRGTRDSSISSISARSRCHCPVPEGFLSA